MEESGMLGALLLYVLGDLIFDRAKSLGQDYRSEFDRYLRDRGFVAEPTPRSTAAS
jgi:hypothetical protein